MDSTGPAWCPSGAGRRSRPADAVAALMARIAPYLGDDAERDRAGHRGDGCIGWRRRHGSGPRRSRVGMRAAAALVVEETMRGVPVTVYPRVVAHVASRTPMSDDCSATGRPTTAELAGNATIRASPWLTRIEGCPGVATS